LILKHIPALVGLKKRLFNSVLPDGGSGQDDRTLI
jgi:hypothetical protein